MDETEPTASGQTTTEELQRQFEALRHFLLSVLILVIVVSGTLTIYLFAQYRFSGKSHGWLTGVRDNYTHGDGPAIEKFVRDSVEYGQKHPDFMPILVKNKLLPPPGANVPPAAAKAPPPAPGPVPVKK